MDVVDSPKLVPAADGAVPSSGNASELSVEVVAGGADGAEPDVVPTPLDVAVSEVPVPESLVDCAAAGEMVDPVSTTTTVLVMDTVSTVPPVPVAPLLGKIPLEVSFAGLESCRFEDKDEDEDVASCGTISKGELAEVVRESLLLLTSWRLTCRGK